ncbi:MAG: acetyltransferase [Proteobacteria bacterium]|nr:acetyltransferase [Desulfobulbaceae bacterium]MBU4152342.1 acetyltransferase [Pseudomonadota bacterium]MDP2104355.1 DHH family phosphoesterase [Desulfobulbaceae bacterium]
MHYDVFNGDADGLCALHQLRLAEPRPEAELVTGVKRDISLLERLRGKAVAGDMVTVLDISMDSNKSALAELLLQGCQVLYVDHHFAGDIPDAPGLKANIDPSPEMCTSLIVNRLLGGRYLPWAVVAAFGDNLHAAACRSAAPLGLDDAQLAMLRELGELLNYNGYGERIDDLHFAPQDLYRGMQPYGNPFDFINNSTVLSVLKAGFEADMAAARSQVPVREEQQGRIFQFPAEPWGRRVAGVFSNERAREMPGLAHALLVDNGNDTFMVSVRAPLNNKRGADTLCRAFPTGGGRAGAAGVNALPRVQREDFVRQFFTTFSEQ